MKQKTTLTFRNKPFLLSILLICFYLISGALNAQTTEDFEDETNESTTFTDNGKTFNIVTNTLNDNFNIETFTNGGWNGTAPDNKYIGNTGFSAGELGASVSIKTIDGTDDIHAKSIYLFIATGSLTNPSTVLTVEGKKDGVTVYTITKSSGFSNVETFSPNNGFTLIDFATEGGADNSSSSVDELIISTTNDGDYLAIDAFRWDVAPTCTAPDVPTVTYTPTTVCEGNNATLNISGSLNDATQWSVYTGSCGGTLVGTTATSSISVTPSAPSTTYYIRGEGGCVTPGSCGTVTVNVTAQDDASFNYSASSYCANDADPTPSITGTSGGTFSSTAGLSINASNGTIDVSASTPGTYTVTYTTTGTCPNSSNVSVTINALDDASFSYSATN